jgi:hypothetical protein
LEDFEMDDDLPEFERFPEHEFQIGESIYVIDPNEFDIWTAEVTEVLEDEIGVHYPDWPEDDGLVARSRCLVISDKNKEIFEDQEETRAEKERHLSSEDEFGSSDNEAKTTKKRKTKTQKKKPPKEKKPPREKKPPKEKKVRPPKEKKERLKKERKPKQETKKKEVKHGKRENFILNKARMEQVRTIEDFEDFLDRHYGDDQEVTDMRDELIRRYQRYASERHDGDSLDDLFESSGSEEVESSSSEIEERYYEPEHIRLPPPDEMIEGFGVRMPSYLPIGLASASGSHDGILFNEDGDANCFIYEVGKVRWLILNGHKFLLRDLNDGAHPEFYCCKNVEVVEGNLLTGSIFYPKVKAAHDISLVHPTEDGEYWDVGSDKKQRKGQVSQLDEIPVPPPKADKPKPQKKGKQITESVLEDSSSSD